VNDGFVRSGHGDPDVLKSGQPVTPQRI